VNQVPIEIEHANESDFRAKVVESPEAVLVDFWAEWCGPCHVLAREIQDVAQNGSGFRIVKVSIEENPAVADRYSVMTIPTVVLFHKGRELARLVGVHAAEDLRRWVKNQLARAPK
jgi:thioredoxin